MTQESELTGRRYWQSLDELVETPGFRDWVEKEFPSGASELDGVNRRNFMKIMAASFGFAGLGMSGCRRPEQNILPYSEQPEQIIPGVPNYYSSSVPDARDNLPVIVETHQARPTKIEGNPSYRPYGGGTDIYAQASVLELYDPDRATRSRIDGAKAEPAAVRDLLASIGDKHRDDGGAGLVFLAEPSTSPSRRRLAEELKEAFPKAVWAEYEPVDKDVGERASERVFGRRVRQLNQFSRAERIVSIDGDFVHASPGKLGNARGFADGRRIYSADEASSMSRLYSVESDLTLTGSMADHRLRSGASQMGALAAQLSAAVFRELGRHAALAERLEAVGADLEIDPQWVRECARDLASHRETSLVVGGEHLPEAVHALLFVLNDALGAYGSTARLVEAPAEEPGIEAAAERLRGGDVEDLVILGGNPVYNAPAGLDWKALQAKAGRVVHLSYYFNETSVEADARIARTHYLESWGDGRAYDGTLLPVQPMIEPLFPAFDALEALARVLGRSETDPHAIVRETFAGLPEGGPGDAPFNRFLSDGLVKGSAYPPVDARPDPAGVEAGALAPVALSADHLELLFQPSSHTYDGRHANNGWMMEVPDPLSKLAWDNAILISPRLAKELQKESGIPIIPDSSTMAEIGQLQQESAHFQRGKEMAPMGEVTLDGRSVRGPLHVLPGLANYTVVLPLGFGRRVVGRVGHQVGFDAYPLGGGGQRVATGAQVKVLDETQKLANTQEHWAMEGRAIVREANAGDYEKNPEFAQEMGVQSHSPPIYGRHENKSLQFKVTEQPRGASLFEHPDFSAPRSNVAVWNGEEAERKYSASQQWGMSIDLNACIGCNACVIACQSENNIPIVGKDQVLRGREMHWIRLDRYFSSAENDPAEIPEDVQVSFMGMMCQHCENAPCEPVCPVNATVHDSQGLNVMAYNRCVGTRYCANNCPYKVRRFNFFDWNKREIGAYYKGPLGPEDEPELEKMQQNPDVTVRMRGVMEKCTYCVQRIEQATIDQKNKAGASDDIHIPDGHIQTACQQVCPTDAIVFGDVADPDTEVSRLKASDRDYSVLGYLNTRPRTTYLARLRNPNEAMPNAYPQPYTRQDYKQRYGHGSGHGEGHGGGHGASGHNGAGAGHGDHGAESAKNGGKAAESAHP